MLNHNTITLLNHYAITKQVFTRVNQPTRQPTKQTAR